MTIHVCIGIAVCVGLILWGWWQATRTAKIEGTVQAAILAAAICCGALTFALWQLLLLGSVTEQAERAVTATRRLTDAADNLTLIAGKLGGLPIQLRQIERTVEGQLAREASTTRQLLVDLADVGALDRLELQLRARERNAPTGE